MHADDLMRQYILAKEVVIQEGYTDEIDWQQQVTLSENTEYDFLREGAWVILSSGMKEAVIRKKFPEIEGAFLNFQDAISIINHSAQCKQNALKIFGQKAKINAIVSLASRIAIEGLESIKTSIEYYGVHYLQSFDFIGPATSYHLAKNLGLDVPKPDRHLCRVAEITGFDSVSTLCNEISDYTGDSVSLVDLVIWRFATLNRDYLTWFSAENKVAH